MSDLYKNDLIAARQRVAGEMGEIIKRAESAARALTTDEQERLTALDAAFDKNTADLARLARAEAATSSSRSLVDGIEAGRAREARAVPDLRTMFQMAKDTGHVGYDLPTTPLNWDMRALQSAGGSAIQTTYADFVTIYERTLTPMLNASVVRVVDVPDGSPRVFSRVTADPNHGGTVTAEAAGINELDATFSALTLTPQKYAIMNLYSFELAQDAAIPLEETVAFTSARELSVDIGAALTTTLGTAAGNGGTAIGTGTTYGTYFGPTDLVNLYYSLAAPYREVGSWMANATTLAQIRNARATTGEFLWQPAVRSGEPETLLGRPIYENPALSNGSAAKSIFFGDFSRFVVPRAPFRVEVSKDWKFGTDQLALRSIERVAGDLVDAASIKYLVNAAV